MKLRTLVSVVPTMHKTGIGISSATQNTCRHRSHSRTLYTSKALDQSNFIFKVKAKKPAHTESRPAGSHQQT